MVLRELESADFGSTLGSGSFWRFLRGGLTLAEAHLSIPVCNVNKTPVKKETPLDTISITKLAAEILPVRLLSCGPVFECDRFIFSFLFQIMALLMGYYCTWPFSFLG